jgi:MFS family permease
MDTIKAFLVDSLNGFSIKYIPLFLFQLITAGLLGYIIQRIINKKFDSKIISYGTVIALGVALICAISKNSLPFAVLAAAAILLLEMNNAKDKNTSLGFFLITIIGIGCGVGSVVQTVIGTVILAIVILFLPLKDAPE